MKHRLIDNRTYAISGKRNSVLVFELCFVRLQSRKKKIIELHINTLFLL